MDEFPALPESKEKKRDKLATSRKSWSDLQNARDRLLNDPVLQNEDEDEAETLGLRHNLLGLLNMARQADPDKTMLVLGHDLSTLGLDLNSSNDLYSMFESPWKEATEPNYAIPSCYTIPDLPPLENTLQNMSTETLFYLFYSCPRDVLQELVAQEL
ncbi:hypothetical protein DFQ28_000167 [Apophysomyces sp. BC1034]|nr:hypothetical protein DFQ29_001765 [Apophysomyces sp. BC1021]KAG0191450.1 hypothetical protein DFQ28_000167 [Apophysomyces sp. BC1034]